jgi:hypothetical protein
LGLGTLCTFLISGFFADCPPEIEEEGAGWECPILGLGSSCTAGAFLFCAAGAVESEVPLARGWPSWRFENMDPTWDEGKAWGAGGGGASFRK